MTATDERPPARTAQRDERSGLDILVVPPADCASWCTKDSHRDSTWDNVRSYGDEGNYQSDRWCRSDLATHQGQSVEGRPVTVKIGLERYEDAAKTVTGVEHTVYPGSVTIDIDGDTPAAGMGYDTLSAADARRVAELLNVAADRLGYKPAMTARTVRHTCVYGKCNGAHIDTSDPAAAEAWMDQHAATVPHSHRWPLTFRIDYPDHNQPSVAYREPVLIDSTETVIITQVRGGGESVEGRPVTGVVNQHAPAGAQAEPGHEFWCRNHEDGYGCHATEQVLPCAPWCQEENCFGLICFSDPDDNTVASSMPETDGNFAQVKIELQRDGQPRFRLRSGSLASIRVGVGSDPDLESDQWAHLTIQLAEQLNVKLAEVINDARHQESLLRSAGIS